MFFYSATPVKPDHAINLARINPTRAYLRHYDNLLFLTFVVNKSDKATERRQALLELPICERKLTYWKRQPTFNHDEAQREIVKKRKEWNLSPA